MTPLLRKFILTSHITFSVGWLGAVAGFFALAVAGLTSKGIEMVRAAYIAMELVSWFVIVPCSISSLLTGIVQSLGPHWGLFKHYWIVAKLILTVGATIFLLLHLQPISYLADAALENPLKDTDLLGMRIKLAATAGAALVVLLATTAMSVYKPCGRINAPLFTKRQLHSEGMEYGLTSKKPWGTYIVYGLISLILLFILFHLLEGGMGNH